MRTGAINRGLLRSGARLALAVAIAGLVAPATAAATEYGGGVVGSPSNVALVGLRTAGNKIQVEVEASPSCGKASDHAIFDLRTPLAADGTFGASVTAHPSKARSVKLDVTNGSVTGDHASGQLTMSTSTKVGKKTVSCTTGLVAWQARAVVVPPTGVASPQAGVTYNGTTSQINAFAPSPFALLVSTDGQQVTRTVFPYRQRCTHGSISYTYVSPSAAIKADGSFAVTERFTQRTGRIVEKFTAEVSGKFAGNGATGSIRVRSTRRNKKTGKVVATCDTKSFSWGAIL
jgi:hypothetical protein